MIMEFKTDIFSQFDKEWALLTAGKKDDFNTMTVSWGGLGTLWGKNVVTIYVRTSRYTHEYVDNNDTFTLTFFPEKYKSVLGVLGSKSGREMDKMHESGLTPIEVEGSVGFAEATTTFVCKKLFKQGLEVENIPDDIVDQFYKTDAMHDMYIAEVCEIIKK